MRSRRVARCGVGCLLAALLCVPAHARDVPTYPIARVNREVPPNSTFVIQGYVTAMWECPPCPPNAVCAPCQPPTIIVSSRSRRMAAWDPLTAQDVRVATRFLTGLHVGRYYRLTVGRASVMDGNRARRVFDLVAFEPASAVAPRLQSIDDGARTSAVRAIVEARLGQDFLLDHLPGGATLERGHAYLTRLARDSVRDALIGVPTVYGLTFELTVDRAPVTVLVFATRPDFSGEFVYTVSRYGDAWPVFLHVPK